MYELKGNDNKFEGEYLLIGVKKNVNDGVVEAYGYSYDVSTDTTQYGGISGRRIKTGGTDGAGDPIALEAFVTSIDWNTYVVEDVYEGIGVKMVDPAGDSFAPFVEIVFEVVGEPDESYALVKTNDGFGGYMYIPSPSNKRSFNERTRKLFVDNVNNQINFRLKCYISK